MIYIEEWSEFPYLTRLQIVPLMLHYPPLHHNAACQFAILDSNPLQNFCLDLNVLIC